MFLFFAFAGTQVANSTQADGLQMVAGSSTSILLYICLSFGFSLAINVWTFFRISGGLFNPAVSTPRLPPRTSGGTHKATRLTLAHRSHLACGSLGPCPGFAVAFSSLPKCSAP